MPTTLRAQRTLDLSSTPLGDTDPKEAWDELVDLLRVGEFDSRGRPLEVSLSREIFLRRLPQNIRSQLEGAEDMEMDALVQKANNLHLADKAARHAATASINAVGEIDDDAAAACTPEINAVYHRRPPFQRQRPTNQQQHRQQTLQKQSQHNAPDFPFWCYYHRVWGNKSRKCSPPCKFPKN